MPPLPELPEKWAETALGEHWVEAWRTGAIFPREMAYFVARCDQLDINHVIESGRQDGFSTEILGRFARDREVRISSIDYETDTNRAARCRARLSGNDALIFLVGDSHELLGALVRDNRKDSCALLLDGPKQYWALALAYAASGYDAVKLIGIHNMMPEATATAHFRRHALEPLFHEDIEAPLGGAWRSLSAAEAAFCGGRAGNRTMERSTLAVLRVCGKNRRAVSSACHARFVFYQPWLIRLIWRLGHGRAAARLYGRSYQVSYFLGLER